MSVSVTCVSLLPVRIADKLMIKSFIIALERAEVPWQTVCLCKVLQVILGGCMAMFSQTASGSAV